MNLQDAKQALEVQPAERAGELNRFFRFAGVGAVAAAANVTSRMLLSRALPFATSVAIAYLIGMAVAFTLSRIFVFDESGRLWQRELARFALVNAVAFVQVWAVSLLLAEWLFPRMHFAWHAESVAHLIGVASPIALSYLGHKHFSFRG